MDNMRILSNSETQTRRADQAASAPGAAIDMCRHPGCGDRARHGPYCENHRPAHPQIGVAYNLTDDEYDRIRAQVDADAAPLFVLAMNWIAGRKLAQMGISLDALEASMHRIRRELGDTS